MREISRIQLFYFKEGISIVAKVRPTEKIITGIEVHFLENNLSISSEY